MKTLWKNFQKVEKHPMAKKDKLPEAAIVSLCLTMFMTAGFFYILNGFFDRTINIVLLFVFPAITFSVLTIFLNRIFRNMKLESDADVVSNDERLIDSSGDEVVYNPAYSNLSCNVFHRSNDD